MKIRSKQFKLFVIREFVNRKNREWARDLGSERLDKGDLVIAGSQLDYESITRPDVREKVAYELRKRLLCICFLHGCLPRYRKLVDDGKPCTLLFYWNFPMSRSSSGGRLAY
ncbi:unnamed protein product [Cochlearia groenlandica]